MSVSNVSLPDFNQRLLSFIHRSPTPFHCVKTMVTALKAAGFTALYDGEPWQLKKGGRYFVTRNGSSIVAFVYGSACPRTHGVRLVGAHTDSPCLMVKPQPELSNRGYFRLGVEVYGGALLNPWFDRDLSIAGRVVYRNAEGQLGQTLVDFEKAVAVIPSLAIHLDREANQGRTINPQTDILPILFTNSPKLNNSLKLKNSPKRDNDSNVEQNETDSKRESNFRKLLAKQFLNGGEVIDYELYLYDTQPPALLGLDEDFIASARLDNQLSCFIGLQSLLAAGTEQTAMLVCSDHEEVGSSSACGAQGPLLASLLERLFPDSSERTQIIQRSLLVSADNAHGLHPNYPHKHDENHRPLLNAGPVIKINARQRYATNSLTAALFRQMADDVGVKLQTFVTRNDMPCGSTIGPITATEVGVPTLDVGVPTFAMHSIRELAGVADSFKLFKVLEHFFTKNGAHVVADLVD